ncbi:hypothetical protein MUK42_07276 [Musa troglodytarum]|uniref:Uncharacterized protein n=1 Tax=Musa troglodytarum TaxID=320322 RepID=A0A9E7JP69_9LILI|nr:hypothetical protein MUK42_07276 [Musa troglodytarum]
MQFVKVALGKLLDMIFIREMRVFCYLAMMFGLKYALTVSASLLSDTLTGFRRVSGKSSINFSFFELQMHHR